MIVFLLNENIENCEIDFKDGKCDADMFLNIPSGKDVNDLTKEQFENILNDKIVYKQTV